MIGQTILKTSISLLAAIPLVHCASQPSTSRQGTLSFTHAPNITRVTIHNPPINLFDNNLASDMLDFLTSIQPSEAPNTTTTTTTPPPKVVIFDSADPDFFIAHVDLTRVLAPFSPETLTFFTTARSVVELLRNTTTSVFISELDGRVSGVGNEFLLQTDIRFAGPNARASQLEAGFGTFPGAGGMQALPRLVNRGRGLQYILSGTAVDGERGAEVGWFNEYYGDKGSLRSAVDGLAERIALFPAGVIDGAKKGVVELYPGAEVYERDMENFFELVNAPEGQDLIRRAIQLGENQTRSRFELGIPDTLVELYQ